MKLLGFYWGVLGVLTLLGSAVWRLLPAALALADAPLQLLHWLALLAFVPFMAYSEGYHGFHRQFSPRVVARAAYLRRVRRPWLALLAPLFCMGFVHATLKRRLTSFAVLAAIVVLVLLVRQLDQPWRGIIDAGVVVGLVLGMLSIAYHWIRLELGRQPPAIPLDLPSFW